MIARAAAVAIAALVLAGAAPARADVAGRKAMVATDLTANTLIVVGLVGHYSDVGFIGVGLGAYLIGGPIVHARYGDWALAGESLGLRAGAPVALGFLGCVAFGDRHGGHGEHRGDPDDACLLGGFGGAALGIIGAELIDWTILSADAGDPAPAPRMITIGGSF